MLEEAIQVAPDIQPDDILCAVEPTSDKTAHVLAEEAIDLLEKAVSYHTNMAQGYLLLGRANCMVGESESAIEYYDTFTQLKENNPLGHLEAGFASANVCSGYRGIPTKQPL